MYFEEALADYAGGEYKVIGKRKKTGRECRIGISRS